MRKVFVDELPKKEGLGALKNKQVIDWKASIGYKVKFQYEDINGEVEIISYNTKLYRLALKYLNNNFLEIDAYSFLKCKLGKLLGIKTLDFKIEIGTQFKDDKRDLMIIDREYRKNKRNQNQKYYKYKCNICGWDKGWIREEHLLNMIGCSCCSGQIVVEGINDIPTTVPWMIKYFQGGYDEAKLYTKSGGGNPNNRGGKIYPICPDCGRVKNKPILIYSIYNNHSIGCSCGDGKSYPEKFMFNILNQLKINFEIEYSPEWIKPKRYDFYFKLNNKEYIIEMDGELGHGNKIHSKSKLTKEETVAIDDYKDKLAKEHDIEVIRIDCNYGNNTINKLEYIKSNIMSKLSQTLNLKETSIDWIKCNEFALSNLCKKACDYKRNNPDWNTVKIGKLMNLNRHTIRNYLKEGNKLEWCEYNPKKELSKGKSKSKKINSKPVQIFKDNILLGTFESCSELERQSEYLFGTKLLTSCISRICNGKLKNPLYKGFTFKYIK